MTIRVLAPAPNGAAYIYHQSPKNGEHFFVARVREWTVTHEGITSTARMLYCHLCDTVTAIPVSASNADHRELQTLIDSGKVTLVIHSGSVFDPFTAGKEDASAGVTGNARKSIVASPSDSAGRVALCSTLSAVHVDQRPK